MTRVAAIDCGTNSIRLLVADRGDDGVLRDLYRDMTVVRLGQDVDRTGQLAPDAIERTMTALRGYRATADEYGVQLVRMVATSATRDAANSAHFTAAVREVLGVEPDVISGDEEAALSFAGASSGLLPDQGPFLVLDIGGGSTEAVLGTDQVIAARSVDIGCVRLTERRLRADPPTDAEIAAATADIMAALDDVVAEVPVADARTLIGVAGSVTTVAALVLNLPYYDPARIHHCRLGRAEVRASADRLLAMTRAERAALPVMHPGRVDVIGAGALVLAIAMDRFAIDEVLVSEHDILDGIALSIVAG